MLNRDRRRIAAAVRGGEQDELAKVSTPVRNARWLGDEGAEADDRVVHAQVKEAVASMAAMHDGIGGRGHRGTVLPKEATVFARYRGEQMMFEKRYGAGRGRHEVCVLSID